MATRLFVGNLPWSCTNEDLLALFQAHGAVQEVQVITDHATGRPRGFGFVKMTDPAEARRAQEALHGVPFQGRPLTVSEAQSGGPRGGRGSPPPAVSP